MEQTSVKRMELSGLLPWMIVGCSALFYSYQFIIRVFPNVMRDEILHTFAIDAADFGQIIGFYDWAYAIVQIPMGIIMDRFGPRRLITASVFLCTLGCFLFGATTSVYVASMARFLMGMGAASGFIGTLKLGTLWLPPRQLGLVIAVTIVFGTIGATLGGRPLSILIDIIDWKNTLYLLSILGLFLCALVFFVIKDQPPSEFIHHGAGGARKKELSLLEGLKRVFLAPQAWIISLFSMLMYIPLTVWGVGWGVGFVEQACGVDEKEAATVITSMFLGAAVGSPFFVGLSDFLSVRKLPMLLGCSIAFIIHLFIVFFPNLSLGWMHFLFFLVGFTYTSKSLSFAAICETMPKKISGVSLGFMNMIVMLNGAILHPLIGKMLVVSSDGAKNGQGDPYYSITDYRFAMAIVPLSLIVSIILTFFIKETHPNRALNS